MTEGLFTEKLYDVDETRLFYHMMSERSLVTADKTKDQLSVMLCANTEMPTCLSEWVSRLQNMVRYCILLQ